MLAKTLSHLIFQDLGLADHFGDHRDPRRPVGRIGGHYAGAGAELRPAVRSDNGDAVRRVVAESGARMVVVPGYDLGDLPASNAAADLTTEGTEALKVAVRSAEAPAELLAAADLLVEGPPGLREFLQRLLA